MTSDDPVRFIKILEVSRLTGLKPDAVYRGGRQGWFPKKVKVSKRSSAWLSSEIAEFMARRIAERDANQRTTRSPVAASPIPHTGDA